MTRKDVITEMKKLGIILTPESGEPRRTFQIYWPIKGSDKKMVRIDCNGVARNKEHNHIGSKLELKPGWGIAVKQLQNLLRDLDLE